MNGAKIVKTGSMVKFVCMFWPDASYFEVRQDSEREMQNHKIHLIASTGPYSILAECKCTKIILTFNFFIKQIASRNRLRGNWYITESYSPDCKYLLSPDVIGM